MKSTVRLAKSGRLGGRVWSAQERTTAATLVALLVLGMGALFASPARWAQFKGRVAEVWQRVRPPAP